MGGSRTAVGGDHLRRGRHLLVVVALLGVAAYLRRLGFRTPALFYDDVWVAVSSLRGRWYEVPGHGLTAGGFTLLTRPLLHLFGDDGGRVLPFVAGVASPAVLYLVLVDRRIRWPIAAAAGAVLVFSPVHGRNSFAVKQYTLDGLFAIVVIWMAWRLVEDGYRRGRWTALLVVATAGVVLSFQTAAVSAVAILVAGVHGLVKGTDRRWLLATAGATAAVCGAWFLLVVLPNTSEGLKGHWGLAYIYLDNGLRGAVDSSRAVFARLVGGLLDVDQQLLRIGVLGSAAFVVVRRGAVGWLLVGPLAIAAVLAATHQVPLGTGRTDIVYYGPILIMLAITVDAVADRIEEARTGSGRAVAAVALVGAALLALGAASPRYQVEEQRQLTELLEATRVPGEQVLVLGLGQYSYGYYSGLPVRIVEDDVLQTGFDVEVDDPDVVVVPDVYCCREQIEGLVTAATAGDDVVWVVGPPGTGVSLVRAALREAGFERETLAERTGALLERWSRA